MGEQHGPVQWEAFGGAEATAERGRYLLAKAISPQGVSSDARFLLQVKPDEVAASLWRCSVGRELG